MSLHSHKLMNAIRHTSPSLLLKGRQLAKSAVFNDAKKVTFHYPSIQGPHCLKKI